MFAISKALTAGNGPLSALIGDLKYDNLVDGSAAKTNGADIRSLVAANAVMDRLFGIPSESIPKDTPKKLRDELENGLLANFKVKAEYLAKHLTRIAELYPGLVKEIKGEGLIRGIQLLPSVDVYEKTKKIQATLMDNGVLVRHSGDTIIIKPPIVITNSQLDAGFFIIKKVLRCFT